jgi:hypothetical protein
VSSSAPFDRTLAVEIPSTEKPTWEATAPPTEILPWLSFTTLGEVASAANGLVETALEFSGGAVISVLPLESAKVAFSVFTLCALEATSTDRACVATAKVTSTRKVWRAANSIWLTAAVAKPSLATVILSDPA